MAQGPINPTQDPCWLMYISIINKYLQEKTNRKEGEATILAILAMFLSKENSSFFFMHKQGKLFLYDFFLMRQSSH
jgi:hypothetical protein